MSPGFIRLIDLWAGRAVCFALTLVRYALDATLARIRRPREHSVKKILVLKWIEQGATVLAYDAIAEAVSRVGRENVYFSVFNENREIIEILDLIPRENILPIRHASLPQFLLQVLGTLRAIRRLGIDSTVDMEFFARGTAIFAYLTGARNRVGLHRFTSEAPYRGDLLTHRVQYNPHLHITQAYRLLIEALFEKPSAQPAGKKALGSNPHALPQFRPTDAETARVRSILERQAGGAPLGSRIVILNPNASDLLPLRKWETSRFVELGSRILERNPDVTVVITGAPSERESAEAVCSALNSPRALSVAGHTTLREVMVLYTLADVMVTNDSGPGHFAALSEMDSIVLFGPETPRLFGSLSPNSHAMWAALGCSPCVNQLNHRHSPCGDNVCMQAITVDQVYAQVSKLLIVRRTRQLKTA
jgi:ADP-heptose:LPS heptosyltransferase